MNRHVQHKWAKGSIQRTRRHYPSAFGEAVADMYSYVDNAPQAAAATGTAAVGNSEAGVRLAPETQRQAMETEPHTHTNTHAHPHTQKLH